MTSFAIIAHFDPNGSRSGNWRRILHAVRKCVDAGVVVSTGISYTDEEAVRNIGFGIIKRSNLGYDFLSYAVGLDAVPFEAHGAKILFCNDSFFVSDDDVFTSSILRLLNSNVDAAFLTTSTQLRPHGQSFCFAIDRRVHRRLHFRNFFRSVRPQRSRMDVILEYELGLSQCLEEMGCSTFGLFAIRNDFSSGDQIPNPSQHHADQVERELGIVKLERLIRNPLGLANSPRIEELAERARSECKPSVGRAPSHAPAVVICHCHYAGLVNELLHYLDFLPDGSEVYVTSGSAKVLLKFQTGWRLRNVRFHASVAENRGRDIGPFVTVARELDLDDSTPVLKIHGKRSLYSPNGDKWRRDMLQELLPSPSGVEELLTNFESNSRVGMLGPRNSYVSDLSYWGSNRARVEAVVERATGRRPEEDELGFYAGTMFWFRWACLKEVITAISHEDFEPEEGQRDGTHAHVLERAMPMIARAKGWLLWETNDRIDLSPDQVRQRRLEYF